MEKGKIIKLTNALYAVTNLFPEKESLKFSIREKGNSVLSFFVIINNKSLPLSTIELNDFKIKLKREILILFSYFDLAETQEWINPKNFKILRKQYEDILKQISITKPKPKKKVTLKKQKIVKDIKFALTDMQEQVLDILQDNGKMKPSDINHLFPNITPRSIRRELKNLKQRGIINSEGSGRNTSYEINSLY